VARQVALVVGVVALGVAVAGCAGDDPPAWTVAEAESIPSVRGLGVEDQRCKGIGHSYGEAPSRRFRRFDCVAGARNPTDEVATVAVHYRLRAIGEYEGPESKHELERAQFYGGPGIP
jgi:hypothetical protein